MHISDTFILQLNLLAAIALVTIAFALFFKKENVKANIFLGLLLIYPSVSIIINIIFIVFQQYRLLFLAPVNISLNLTFGPVLLSYLYFMQGSYKKRRNIGVIHFIPAVIVFASSLYYLVISETEQYLQFNTLMQGENMYINVINVFLLLHICVYLYTGWQKVKIYERSFSDLGIPVTENSVKWQKALLNYIILANTLLLLAFALPIVFTGKGHIYSDLLATPIAAFIIYIFLIYKGLSYHVIYNRTEYNRFVDAVAPVNHFMEEVEMLEKPDKQSKYTTEFNNEISQKLEQLFHIEKIHTKQGLKLYEVAKLLNMSPAILSTFINKTLKMTFFEMVNHYRVEEAKQMLVHKDCQHYKIEYIGEMSGFNSRTSFFSVFKKYLGKTPQVFKEEYFLMYEKQDQES